MHCSDSGPPNSPQVAALATLDRFIPELALRLTTLTGISKNLNVAAYLGEADSAGTVETGKRADFILVAASPLDDVRNAAQVRGVFTHAKWHSGTELESRLAQVKEHSVSDQ